MAYFGTSWYPEQWQETEWSKDLALMRDAGMNVVRIVDFAWSSLEPEEGTYRFEWLDSAIELAGSMGFSIVIATPTAAPPAWLTQKYPEVVRVDQSGRKINHGGRCHFNMCSVAYLRLTAGIAGKLAERYGKAPHVIGWQIDNEYTTFSYDDETQARFQDFLRDEYATLEELNNRWGGAYWSEDYSDWSQIPIASIDSVNPCHISAIRRFITAATRKYQANQIEAIRRHAPKRQWITHNFHGDLFNGDANAIAKDLDIAAFDYYVASGHLDHAHSGLMMDLTRGLKQRNFWLMEAQPGVTHFSPVNNALDPGEVRALAWHAIGHGADSALYWQWRSCTGGQEQYWSAIVGPHGRPRAIYREISQVGAELRTASPYLEGTAPVADVAVLYADEDRWGIETYRYHHEFQLLSHVQAYHRALRESGRTVDVVNPLSQLDGYKLVVAPGLYLIGDQKIDHLLRYVEAGGHLILGVRSGVKNMDNALPTDYPQPGVDFARALGITIVDHYALDESVAVAGSIGAGNGRIMAERLEVDGDPEILLKYVDGHKWLKGHPAMVTKRCGAGRITYVGFWPDEQSASVLVNWMTTISGASVPVIDVPEGVELCHRSGPHGEVAIVINHTRKPVTLPADPKWRNVLVPICDDEPIVLDAYGVAVLSRR